MTAGPQRPRFLLAAGRRFWFMFKYDWPMEYWYVFTDEADSKGEETDPLNCVDVRTLPAKYIDGLNLSWLPIGKRKGGRIPMPTCGMIANQMYAHQVALSRAVTDGFDFEAHAQAEQQRLVDEDRARLARLATQPPYDDDVPF